MQTVTRPRKKHNPAILRFKRIARAIGVPWVDVVTEKNRLADIEQESRQAADDCRQCGWQAYCRLNGRADSNHAFWRDGFQRAFGIRFARGADYLAIPRADEIAASVREQVPEFANHESGEIFEHLLSEYTQQTPVTDHYSNALAELAHAELSIVTPF